VVSILLGIATFGEGRLGSSALGLLVVVWVSLIAYLVMAARWRKEGPAPGPDMPVGIPNRIFAAALVAWTVGIALAARPIITV